MACSGTALPSYLLYIHIYNLYVYRRILTYAHYIGARLTWFIFFPLPNETSRAPHFGDHWYRLLQVEALWWADPPPRVLPNEVNPESEQYHSCEPQSKCDSRVINPICHSLPFIAHLADAFTHSNEAGLPWLFTSWWRRGFFIAEIIRQQASLTFFSSVRFNCIWTGAMGRQWGCITFISDTPIQGPDIDCHASIVLGSQFGWKSWKFKWANVT
jgi:hypothetical protein